MLTPISWMYADYADDGSNWANNGDIDIYESWNDVTFNRQTLHSKSGCAVSGAGMTNTSTYILVSRFSPSVRRRVRDCA